MDKKLNNSIKINIDKFKSLKHFELFFFHAIKSKKDFMEKGIIIYTLDQKKEIFDHVINEFIPKLEKLYVFLKAHNILVKFVNFPYCISRDETLIKKYFINDVFLNKIYVIEKADIRCYECEYYLMCPWSKCRSFAVEKFDCETIKKQNFIDKITKIYLFFEKTWIPRDAIYFDFLFDISKDFNNLNSILNRKIELFIDWYKWIRYEDYFIDINNCVSGVRTDLFFNNHINQKKFERLLKNLKISIFLSYTDFDIDLYDNTEFNNLWTWWIRDYRWIKYWFLRKKDISLYLDEQIIFRKTIKILDKISWRSNLNKYSTNNDLILKVISVYDIESIYEDFDKYIVLFFEHDLNLFIPKVYKFKYFLSYNKLEELAHYKIILNEIGAQYIDSIWTWFFYGLENWYVVEVNFSTWLIKRIW